MYGINNKNTHKTTRGDSMKIKYLLFIMLVSICLNIQPSTIFASFSDTTGHEHEQSIEMLSEMAIVKGYSNGTFQPSAPLYRKNVALFLGRWLQQNGFELPEDATDYPRFDDLTATSGQELLQLSSLVQEEGIFTGSQRLFNGKGTMQRQHMAVVLVRAMKAVYGIDLITAYKADGFNTTIQDIHKASDQEKREAITALQYAGITQATQFNPTNTLNRGQFTAFLARTIEYYKAQHVKDVQSEQLMDETPSTMKEEQPNEQAPAYLSAKSLQIAANAPLYASLNVKNEIAKWGISKALFPIKPVKEGALFVIELNSEKYYVKASDVTFSETVIQTVSQNVIGTVLTQPNFELFDSNGQLILKGNRETKVDVVRVEDSQVVVKMPTGEAFLPIAQTTTVTHEPLTVVADTKLTKKVGQTSTVIGLIKAGHVFSNFKKEGNHYVFKTGTASYAMSPVVINTTAKAEHESLVKGAYPTELTAEKTATVYSKSGNVIGTLDRGQKVTLLNKTASRGLIEFAGVLGYIDLSEWLHTNIVIPNRNISHQEMTYKLQLFHMLYPEFTELQTIGKSVEGRDILALRVGNGKKEILMDGSLHAREHMTTNVLLEMIDEYSLAYVRGSKFSNIDVRKTLDTTKIWFVPMMNPDGVTLVQGGVNAVVSKASVTKINGSANVARWKANIRGVDLNRNFEGGWAQKSSAKVPSFKNFKGYSVFSEPEARALRDFVAKHQFKAYVSYHSSGQVIYWFHFQNATNLKRDKAFAQKMGNITGYSLMAPLYLPGSGASTDWFIQTYKKPALTMEIAVFAGEGPVPNSQWQNVWNKNKTIGLVSAQSATGF